LVDPKKDIKPKVLVVTKHTNLDLHGENLAAAVKRGIVDRRRLEQLEFEHSQHRDRIAEVLSLLESEGLPYMQIHRRDAWPTWPVELVITVGGDGTFLTACHAKLLGGPVYAGICSTDASVGYLCGYTKSTFKQITEDYRKKSFKLLPRMRAVVSGLDARRKESAGVVNDILYSSPHPSSTLRYRIEVGLGDKESNDEEFHKSSGIWISTSAGSTAAISASGGRKQLFCEPTLQYAVRERYMRPGEILGIPNTNLFRPGELKFVNLTQGAILSLDGRRGELELNYGDEVEFSWADPIKFMTQKKEHS